MPTTKAASSPPAHCPKAAATDSSLPVPAPSPGRRLLFWNDENGEKHYSSQFKARCRCRRGAHGHFTGGSCSRRPLFGSHQRTMQFFKRVFDLVKDFGTSKSPKSTRSSTTHWCPGRPGHPAFRHNIASSLRLHTGLPYDWTPRSDAPLGSPLAPSARRVSRVASRLPGTTRLRFALHGGQRRQLPCGPGRSFRVGPVAHAAGA